jgi:hypothetical protein
LATGTLIFFLIKNIIYEKRWLAHFYIRLHMGGVYTLQVTFGFNWRSNAFFHGGAGSVPMSSLGEPGLLNPVEPINGVSISFHF